MHKTLLSLAIVTSSFGLYGCGGSSSDSTPTNTPTTTPSTGRSITITPVLGKTFNAEVTLESADHSFKVTGNTSSTGSVVFTNIPNNIELFMATVTGSASATYLEEADDFKSQPLDVETKLRAAFILSTNTTSADIPITALTEAAVGYALKQNTLLTYDNTVKANQLMANTFGIDDILRNPILLTNNADYGLLLSDGVHISASRYSVLLSAFAKVTANKTASPLKASVKFAQQLANDVDDDGNINEEGDAYTYSSLQTQINTIINTLGLTTTLALPFTVKTVAPIPISDGSGSTGSGSTGSGSTGSGSTGSGSTGSGSTGSGSTGSGSTGSGSTGSGSTGSGSTGSGSTGSGSTGSGSTGSGSTGSGSTSPIITTPNATPELLASYVGSYTGFGLSNETCRVNIDNTGLISVSNNISSKSATLNGDDLDQRVSKDDKIIRVIAYDASSPNKRLILGITTDNNLLALYGNDGAAPEIGCRTTKKLN